MLLIKAFPINWQIFNLLLQSKEQQIKAKFTISILSQESALGMIHVFQGYYKLCLSTVCQYQLLNLVTLYINEQLFNGFFSRTTLARRNQKRKPSWILMKQ